MTETVDGWILDNFISPGVKLTQGDLIKFENEEDPLKRAGIVVTADCDLDRKKHARLVTLIPIVSVAVIMENYLLPEDCEKKREKIESFAFKAFSIEGDQEREVKKIMLDEKLQSLCFSEAGPSIIAAQFVTDRINKISVSEYKILMNAIDDNTKKPSSIAEQIRKRGDILVLPDVEKLGVDGNIAWVRHIWQVSLSEIAIKTSDVVRKRGERLARLDSPFRYRLTQLLAQVFADIGLPDIPDAIERNIEEVYDHA